MNVLISGGAGFIGSSLAKALVARGEKVTILDNLSEQIHGNNPSESALVKSLPTSINLIKGDVRNREDWLKALDQQDIVVHLAAETGTGQSMYEVDRYVDVNIRGTSILLDILAQNRTNNTVRKIVVASSRAIYGEGKYLGADGVFYPEQRMTTDLESGIFECLDPNTKKSAKPLPTDENSKVHPTSIYGITKQVQEQLILTAAQSIGISAISLRYQNVYGPGQSLKNPYTGILSIFSTQLLQNKEVNIFEDGLESRDFVYIDDVIEATMLSIYSDKSNKTYNVGTGESTPVLQVAELLKKEYASSSEIKISGNFRVGDIRHNFADLTLIKRDLNFRPKTNFQDGVKSFSDWVMTQEISDSGYEKSVAEMRQRGLFK